MNEVKDMMVKSMQLGMIGTNCYIFWAEGSRTCGVVDPGDQGEKVAALLDELKLEPEAVLLTHSHFDHILGIPGLRKRWPALPVYCHPADVDERAETVSLFGQRFPSVYSFGNIRSYREGDRLQVGGVEVEVLETPGHTPGSVTLRAEDTLFTGDTLFCGSMGRTDLPGGNDRQMMDSLRRLAALEGDYRVCPGHEEQTTLERERRSNYCVRMATRK